MAVVRLDRFTVDPGDVEELLARRNALVAAVRNAVPGLIQARLAKLDDKTWIDLWHWDSRSSAQTAIQRARTVRAAELRDRRHTHRRSRPIPPRPRWLGTWCRCGRTLTPIGPVQTAPVLTGRLDLQRAGILGISLGGIGGGEACRLEPAGAAPARLPDDGCPHACRRWASPGRSMRSRRTASSRPTRWRSSTAT